MDTTVNNAGIGRWNAPAAYVALVATAISCLSLILLHALSPEFSPSWRMVSEYANGSWPWVLTLVFVSWAISSFALAVSLWLLATTNSDWPFFSSRAWDKRWARCSIDFYWRRPIYG